MYSAIRAINHRPIGEVLKTGTMEEVDPYWVPGEVLICWTPVHEPVKRLSQSSLSSYRRTRLKNRLRKKFPLIWEELYQSELSARPDFFAGIRQDLCAAHTS